MFTEDVRINILTSKITFLLTHAQSNFIGYQKLTNVNFKKGHTFYLEMSAYVAKIIMIFMTLLSTLFLCLSTKLYDIFFN